MLEQRRPDCPSLYMDEDDIIFGIICNDDNTYIMDPCCLGKDLMTASQRLVRQHGMNSKRSYRIPRTTLLDFSEILLTIYEYITGIAMDSAELYLNARGIKDGHIGFGTINGLTDELSNVNEVIKYEHQII